MSEVQDYAPAPGGLQGETTVPGDKSISHRALLVGAVSCGDVEVRGFLPSHDTLATLAAVRALGVEVERGEDWALLVHGGGWEGLREPEDVIDVGNAGTLMRLLPGLLAGRPFFTLLTGDGSIRRRPMGRVLQPLSAMGAVVLGREHNTLPPVGIRGGALRGMDHELAVASAQVKSCLLLAGLQADTQTKVVEPAATRDHTERIIAAAGGRVESRALPNGGVSVTVHPLERPVLGPVKVPGDFSSAAFLLVAALLLPGSEVTVLDVGLNPTRTALLDVLERMGADLRVHRSDAGIGEPLGAITAKTSVLTALDIGPELAPLLIDELPIWALAAARAEGTSRLRGAGELRVKESDRLRTLSRLLRALGIDVTETPDGLDIQGDPSGWDGAAVETRGDHRLAMVGAVAGLLSRRGVRIDDGACISVSFPGFPATIEALRRPGGTE